MPTDPIVRDLLYSWLYVTVNQYETVTAAPPSGTPENTWQDTITNTLIAALSAGPHVDLANIGALTPRIKAWVGNMRVDPLSYSSVTAGIRASGPVGTGGWTGPNHPTAQELDDSFA